ncbi:DNA primase [Pedobacter flavus]|uniref:DNA primase n=1 Tax=Pedobacter flavus TaxID=3113906 RepID=A0ABU7GYQ0_9SPHI|nr:DNA primase [Pedobacter sp. VNH31]MEE1884179.1 DNA primase [Pedobacter sp. VNH31]
MITQETIDKIMETARIEEVVGDFVNLKKRGTSLIGNCPFHNEKTPSFNVSAVKGIFKCFGCGKAGDSVRFIMEHENYSYPEALKFLANKYHIEIEETVDYKQDAEVQQTKENLFIISQYASDFFKKELWEGEEGKAIGLSYFKERGFREDIIKKFELGFSPDIWDALYADAIKNGYKLQYLEETGLCIKNDNGKIYDRFRGRVMFPIHNITGRIIGFGGRTLKSDKNIPKYVNSPESPIYHKSNVLYGLFQAKKAIRDNDNCYLVEGYADVLSVHQAGVENVVASSGTSLTIEQVRLIGRFTKNITILFDGDSAGVKASLRGLDIILEEGLNVKIVSFPDGHDPDSYMHHVGAGLFKEYLEQSKKDFILYKANVLLAEAGSDPIKRAELIRDIVESIAKIPDQIKTSIFIRECSNLLKVEERILISELNKIRSAKIKKAPTSPQPIAPDAVAKSTDFREDPSLVKETNELQEREIIRLLLTYGHEFVSWDEDAEKMYIGPFIMSNLTDVQFEDPVCRKIIEIYYKEIDLGHLPTANQFIKSDDNEIAHLAVTLSSSPYHLSENWYDKHKIYVRDESVNLKSTILGGIFHLKKRKVDGMLENLLIEIKTETDPVNQEILMKKYALAKNLERSISEFLGSVIVK